MLLLPVRLLLLLRDYCQCCGTLAVLRCWQGGCCCLLHCCQSGCCCGGAVLRRVLLRLGRLGASRAAR